MNETLQYHKIKVMEHKDYFVKSGINKPLMVVLALVIPAFLLGWQTEKRQWGSRLTQEILEVGLLAFMGNYKKQLLNLFKELS